MLERSTLIALIVLGGCAAPRPSVLAGADPSDPAAPPGVIATVPHVRDDRVAFPAAAGDWVEMNRRVAPQAGRAP